MTEMGDLITKLREATLRAYGEQPDFIREHYGIEQTVLAGGYGYRQVLELVQNGADAILEAHEAHTPLADGNRIQVVLRGSHLYVANTGAALSEEGDKFAQFSHVAIGTEALLSNKTSPAAQRGRRSDGVRAGG